MSVITLGIDIGSTTSKCAIMRDGQEITATAVLDTGVGTDGAQLVIAEAMSKSCMQRKDIDYIVVTGYGRRTFNDSDDEISELSCHAKGAVFLFPCVRTVIDIGGQDAKVLKIGEDGRMKDFLMNDKCAAGTGRFLEVMARVLNIPIDDFDKISAESKKKVDISATCTVFAETEVISHLANAVKKEDILAGIHRSIAARVCSLAERVGIDNMVVFTGGVARNGGMVRALEEKMGTAIYVNEYCQLNGAIGAALYGYEMCTKKNR